jgi:catechol 2,3-dioxygenase-like lactoylglutathione lyase family enzyme
MATLQLSTAQPARQTKPTVKARALAYLIFERSDFAAAEKFLTDFGLRLARRDSDALYFRGTGSAPFCYVVRRAVEDRFVGMGFALDSRDDLLKLAGLPGAGTIKPLTTPGGGEVVSLSDPAGFSVEAVFGQTLVEALPHREPLAANQTDSLPRINATQRPPHAPAEIIKLGHAVLEVADFQAVCAWYTGHLGLIPSDVQVLPDGVPIVTFMRLNLGDTPADHHTLAIAQGFMNGYSHSAYEVVDVDALGMGQRVLREQGYRHAWGIGRHILGSQLFDYWNDPWGDKHEHYCDGDMFTAGQPTGIHPVSAEAMAQWGPAMPRTFTAPKMNLAAVRALLHSLRHSPDVTLRKLLILKRLFG